MSEIRVGQKRDKPDDADELESANSEMGAPPAAGDFITKSDIEAMFADFATKIDDSTTSLKGSLQQSFVGMLTQYNTTVEARFSAIDHSCSDLRKRQDAMDEGNKTMWATINKLQADMAVAETAVPVRDPVLLADTNFERVIDITILTVTTQAALAKDKVSEALTPWLDELQIASGGWKLTGPALGKRFSIQFAGNAGLAENRQNKAFELLRNSDRQWREFYATAPDGARTKIFIGRDKNQKMVKTEVGTKKLADIVKKLHPTLDTFAKRADGIISVNWQPLIKLDVKAGKLPATLNWNIKAADDLHIDRELIATEFRKFEAAKNQDVEWSV